MNLDALNLTALAAIPDRRDFSFSSDLGVAAWIVDDGLEWVAGGSGVPPGTAAGEPGRTQIGLDVRDCVKRAELLADVIAFDLHVRIGVVRDQPVDASIKQLLRVVGEARPKTEPT